MAGRKSLDSSGVAQPRPSNGAQRAAAAAAAPRVPSVSVKPGSNWKALQRSLSGSGSHAGEGSASASGSGSSSNSNGPPARKKHKKNGSAGANGSGGSSVKAHGQTTPPPPGAKSLKGKEKALRDEALSLGPNGLNGSASTGTTPSTSKVGSPAPTSLPWFADDLSPEDLALVRQIQEGGDATVSSFGAKGTAAAALLANAGAASGAGSGEGAVGTNGAAAIGVAVPRMSSKEAALKKRVILGGWDENASAEKKA